PGCLIGLGSPRGVEGMMGMRPTPESGMLLARITRLIVSRSERIPYGLARKPGCLSQGPRLRGAGSTDLPAGRNASTWLSKEERETTMKRTHEISLIAGMAVGLAVGFGGVAPGVLLARKEGRTMRQLLQQAAPSVVSSAVPPTGAGLPQDDGLHVRHLTQQARQAGMQMAKMAGDQYLPKAKEALSGALAH